MLNVLRGFGTALLRHTSPRQLLALPLLPALALSIHFATVRPGDTLSKIAARDCGTSRDWTGIYAANRHVIGSDPNLIMAGQHLRISCRIANIQQAHPWSRGGGGTVTVSYTDPAGHLTRSQVGALWLGAGGPAWAEWSAEQIAWCESGWYTGAYNPSGASGLFQILGSVVAGNLFDARVNALNAVAKFRADGDTFAAWVCRA